MAPRIVSHWRSGRHARTEITQKPKHKQVPRKTRSYSSPRDDEDEFEDAFFGFDDHDWQL